MKSYSSRHLTVALAVSALGLSVFASSANAAPPQVLAGDKIKLSDSFGGNSGGEFKATALTGNSPSFMTFCVEYNEHFYYDKPLLVSKVNTGAKSGGAGGSVADPNGGTWDPISAQTAYLYTAFATGTLNNYEFGSTTAAQKTEHTNDGSALQLAFWYLEGEISSTVNSSVYSLYNSNTQAKSWVAQANNAVTSGAWSGIGQVRVLNLLREGTIGSGNFNTVAQDQLYLMPVPEPETYAMLLAGLGLIGFVAKRRRRGLGA